MIEATRAEQGCVRYDWYQDSKESGILIGIQTFASVEALEQHRQTAHFHEVVEAAKAWVSAPPEFRVLKPEYVKH
jgi:quinol monooxygenase YgiN